MRAHEEFSLARVQVVNLLLLVAMPVAAGLVYSSAMAMATLIGALIANISFMVLKNDLTKLMQGPLQAVKVRFFIKYYLRLSALGVLLYFLVRYGHVQVFGLLVGLSAVVVGILIAALGQAKTLYFSGKEVV